MTWCVVNRQLSCRVVFTLMSGSFHIDVRIKIHCHITVSIGEWEQIDCVQCDSDVDVSPEKDDMLGKDQSAAAAERKCHRASTRVRSRSSQNEPIVVNDAVRVRNRTGKSTAESVTLTDHRKQHKSHKKH